MHILPNFDFTAVLKATIEEESKRHNAVLFGLDEVDDDLEAVREIVSAGNPIEDNLKLKPSDIIRVFRDGPTYNDKPRFLKVVCVTSKVQRSFIGLINKIVKKHHPELRARQDLTWEQRETGRLLRQKLSTVKDSVEYFIDYNKKYIVKKSDSSIF